MSPNSASMAMLAVMLTAFSGLGCLFFYWLAHSRGTVEEPKHLMLASEHELEQGELDSEVYL